VGLDVSTPLTVGTITHEVGYGEVLWRSSEGFGPPPFPVWIQSDHSADKHRDGREYLTLELLEVTFCILRNCGPDSGGERRCLS
jgi:hypothetical protein